MKYFVAILGLAAMLSLSAFAQIRNAPPVYDKPGDRDDSTRLVAGPRVAEVTSDSAVIEWRTSGNGANHVRYGQNPNHPDKSVYVPGGSRDHRMTLTGLEPGRTYYFFIMERDGEVRQGGTGSFVTPRWGAGPMAQPGIHPVADNAQAVRITNGPVVEHVDDKSAVIAWSTNVPSGSVVHYGHSAFTLEQSAQAPWGGTTHRVQLTNLQPNTTYFYRIDSGQAEGSGTDSKSRELSFHTHPRGR